MMQLRCAGTGHVEFPNLFGGLKFSVSEEAFNIFGFGIQWYGLIIGAGLLLCVFLGMRACRHYGIDQDDLLDYLLFCVPAAVVGARLYYVVFNFDEFRNNLTQIFNIRSGGLAVYGGILAAMLVVFFVCKYKKQSFLKLVDFAAPYILLGQGIGRWGNFFNQEAYGGPTTLPWGMTGNQIAVENIYSGLRADTLVHPTFLYESLWCLLGFALLLWYRSRFKKADAECICLYMVWYGLERSLVEGLRTDSLYIGNTGIRVSQLLSVILLLAGVVLFIVVRMRYNKKQATEGALDPAQKTGFEGVKERLDAEE